MLLLKNVDLYSPAPAGRADILIAGGRIERVAPELRVSESWCEVFEIMIDSREGAAVA